MAALLAWDYLKTFQCRVRIHTQLYGPVLPVPAQRILPPRVVLGRCSADDTMSCCLQIGYIIPTPVIQHFLLDFR